MKTVKDCNYPWTWLMVTSDGNCKPCCFAPGSLGNLNDQSADEIWNGEIAIELRTFIKEDRLHPICNNAPCVYVQNMPNQVSDFTGSSGKIKKFLFSRK